MSGTLGYAGNYAVRAQLPGTLTALPTPGTVIGQGQVLYRVDNSPVVLLFGSTRTLPTASYTWSRSAVFT